MLDLELKILNGLHCKLVPRCDSMKIRSFFFEMRSWIFSVGLIFANMLYLAESQQCRRCDQIISGRNLAYSRALEIIQEEEYLDEEEFDEIRYKRNLRVKNEFRKKHAKVFERVKRPRTKRQTEIVTGGKKAVCTTFDF